MRKKRRRRRRVCRYIGEGERWIVVFGVRFCLEVGIKINFHGKALKRNGDRESHVPLVNKYCLILRL